MTHERIREALAAAAAEAPDPGDLWACTTRRIRRRRWRRWGGTTGAAIAIVLVGAATLVGLDQRPDVLLGEPGVPEGWQDILVGEAVLSVPPDWQVADLTDVRPEEAEPGFAEPELEGGATEPERGATEPEQVPCPAIDPDRPVLVHSRQMLPAGCPENPEALTGLAVVPLDAPAPWDSQPAMLEAGERVEVSGVPARAVRAALVTTPAPSDAEERATADATTLVAPGVGVHVEVRPGANADAVEAVLETLRPRDAFDTEAALHQLGVYDAEPGSGHDRERLGWAINPDGTFHRWFHEPVDPQEQNGFRPWLAATAHRFGGIVDTGDRIRVIAARPGDDAPVVFTLPDEASANPVMWSPAGEAVAWLVLEPEPRLTVADWGHPDKLADGADPELAEVTVTGLPAVDTPRHVTVGWEEHDERELIIAYLPDPADTHIAEIQRNNGRLDLQGPLTFRSADPGLR